MNLVRDPFRRVWIALGALALVLVVGTVGFLMLGFSLLDAVFQTISTVTTVGFTSPHRFTAGDKAFTIFLILVGVGTALYTFSAVFELLVDGHMRSLLRRRTMERNIARMEQHVIVCGWGRVGSEVARFLTNAGRDVVVVDRDQERLATCPFATGHGEVTDDEVLLRAGADRVVNPQQLGGNRMASFVTQPHVVDFVDVVMHDGSLQFRLGESAIAPDSVLADQTLRSAHIRNQTGALVLAIRRPDGGFVTNPAPEDSIRVGDVLISVGTEDQLRALADYAARK